MQGVNIQLPPEGQFSAAVDIDLDKLLSEMTKACRGSARRAIEDDEGRHLGGGCKPRGESPLDPSGSPHSARTAERVSRRLWLATSPPLGRPGLTV